MQGVYATVGVCGVMLVMKSLPIKLYLRIVKPLAEVGLGVCVCLCVCVVCMCVVCMHLRMYV